MISLEDFYLFRKIAPEQMTRLKEISIERHYHQGNILFFEGDMPKELLLLVEGIVKIYKVDHKGNQVVISYFFPPTLIAEMANLESMPYPATAEFETDGRIIAIDYAAFEKEFLKNPEIAMMLIKSLNLKIKKLESTISRNLAMDSTSRVAKFIYENEMLFLDLKLNKIASILHMTPETLSRILKKFKSLGILETDGKSYHIIEKEELREFFES